MSFLRYPGGKAGILQFLSSFLPKRENIRGRYIEPFLGGGSVFLYLKPKRAIISDLNKELIDIYRGIRDYPYKVWKTYAGFPAGKKAYYKIRDEGLEDKPLYYRAARTLFLNRTCFKGMWRHNRKGDFNVGYGGEDRRWVFTRKDLVELSRLFNNAVIQHADFAVILDKCRDGDFLFLDPPYKPGEKEMTQEHYINGKFSFQEQIRLSEKLREVTKKYNINWIMTNSSAPEISELYHGFQIQKMPVGTSDIAGVRTKNSKEIFIMNF
jgi:DNA adenine methylase